MRRVIAGFIVAGLAVGVWALWPDSGPDPTTTLAAATSTSSSVAGRTTQGTTTTTATTIGEGEAVITVEEAETILRELWFGWFEGIYNQDEDRIKEVVGSQSQLDAARAQFGVMEFLAPPRLEAFEFVGTEILHTDSDCLAVWTETSAAFRAGSSQGVNVLRRRDESHVFVGYWPNKSDLWEADCVSVLEPLS